MLNVIDEFTHECLAIRIDRRLKAVDVIDVLSDLFILRGVPGHIRSDNGPEFVAKAAQEWIAAVGARTAYIAPGSRLTSSVNWLDTEPDTTLWVQLVVSIDGSSTTLKLTPLSARLRDNPVKVRGYSLAIFRLLITSLASQASLSTWHQFEGT